MSTFQKRGIGTNVARVGTHRVVSYLAKVASKGLFVVVFLVLMWGGRFLVLPEVLTIGLAVFVPFGVLGATWGALAGQGSSRITSAVLGARNSLVVAFLFCTGLCSFALLFALQVGNPIRPSLYQMPVLVLILLTAAHTALRFIARRSAILPSLAFKPGPTHPS